jgi:Ribbon-helix-helix protein, copG family
MIGLRAGEALTAAIDVWALANEIDRSEAMRRLIRLDLERASARKSADLPPLMGAPRKR